MKNVSCQNCGEALLGNYCHHCGEKKILSGDYSFLRMITDGFEALTNMDSKFFKTFAPLLFRPGHLTNEHIKGRRKPYMKPFQLYLICNLIFFIFLTDSDIFRAPAKWFFQTSDVKEKAMIKAERNEMTYNEFSLLYDSKSSAMAKGLIIILIPLMGLLSYFLNYNRTFEYGKHVILVIHLLAFILLFCVALMFTLQFFRFLFPELEMGKLALQIPLISAIFYYLFFSIRAVFSKTLITSILKSTILTFLIVVLILTYRHYVSLMSFHLIA